MEAILVNMCVALFAELTGVGVLTIMLYVFWNKMTA